MTTQEKKEVIKAYSSKMLEQSYEDMIKKIDKVINSGSVDVESWDVNSNPYVLVRSILSAILDVEAQEYNGVGTSFEKGMKREIKNIKLFI
jgi:hypothetical protein